MGVEEPLALIHAPNESVDPNEIQAMALSLALFLQRLRDRLTGPVPRSWTGAGPCSAGAKRPRPGDGRLWKIFCGIPAGSAIPWIWT